MPIPYRGWVTVAYLLKSTGPPMIQLVACYPFATKSSSNNAGLYWQLDPYFGEISIKMHFEKIN